eukprot:TRINITY_DN6586_c0_g3_i5.p1 TRINITY_DN6586_c0_g3~~TRINITY_DN6586_c0_g3_i5.p1  ORF type:complete len:284 (+),score=43.49 TRINITY_DN6586_c0_g3_i5:165-1016(+)
MLAFILSRFVVVTEKLGLSIDEADQIKSTLFPHLSDVNSFESVLVKHREEAERCIATNGIGHFLDHTVLKPATTMEEVTKLCSEAREYNFGAVCVNGSRAQQALVSLEGTNVNVAVVVGFPLGASTSLSKVNEANELWSIGCHEIDVVVDVGRVKDKDYLYVKNQLSALVENSKDKAPRHVTNKNGYGLIKLILETCFLTKEEIVDVSILAVISGVGCVKTSTGFGSSGAALQDVELMRSTVGHHVGVKASGGIRDLKAVKDMIHAALYCFFATCHSWNSSNV